MDGGPERYANFVKALGTFGLIKVRDDDVTGSVGMNTAAAVSACGADWKSASSECKTSCQVNTDCPDGQYCYAGVSCPGLSEKKGKQF